MSRVFASMPRLPDPLSGYTPNTDPEGDQPQIQYTYDETRRRALEEVDEARFSIFHVKTCLIAGVGFFTCAYNIFAIGIAETMIGLVYEADGNLSSSAEILLKVSTQVGTFFGPLIFGWLVDALGRKMYGLGMMIGEAITPSGLSAINLWEAQVILTTLAQACAGEARGGRTVGIIGILGVLRFVMGIGIGAGYPLASVMTSRLAPRQVRGRMVTAVFATQGFGNFAAALVALIITVAFQNQIKSEVNDQTRRDGIDRCWRLLIGLGAVPGCIALYCQLTIPETPRFAMDVERNVQQAARDTDKLLRTELYNVDSDAVVRQGKVPKASWGDFRRYFGQWRNFKLLFGMAYAWFALDIPFYTLGLNTLAISKALGTIPKSCNEYRPDNSYNILYGVSRGNLILAVGGLIPGYWATFCFIDSWGRKPIQIMGFIVLTILFTIIGTAWDPLHNNRGNGLVALYCLANFFQNFGPNTTTFIVPGEAFPTRYRATAYGISAALGKLGAILSQIVYSILSGKTRNVRGGEGCEDPDPLVRYLVFAFAFFTLTGAAATLLIEETKGRALEDILDEDPNKSAERRGPSDGVDDGFDVSPF